MKLEKVSDAPLRTGSLEEVISRLHDDLLRWANGRVGEHNGAHYHMHNKDNFEPEQRTLRHMPIVHRRLAIEPQ